MHVELLLAVVAVVTGDDGGVAEGARAVQVVQAGEGNGENAVAVFQIHGFERFWEDCFRAEA